MEPTDSNTNIRYLITQVREFVEERDWEKYLNPKDLAESICIEAAELLQLFQWTKPEKSQQFKSKPSKVQRIKEELADVVIYCLSMANTLNIDLTTAILEIGKCLKQCCFCQRILTNLDKNFSIQVLAY